MDNIQSALDSIKVEMIDTANNIDQDMIFLQRHIYENEDYRNMFSLIKKIETRLHAVRVLKEAHNNLKQI